MFVKPTTAFSAIVFGSAVVGAMGERVAVDGEQHAQSDSSSSRNFTISRSVASAQHRRSRGRVGRRSRPARRRRCGACRGGAACRSRDSGRDERTPASSAMRAAPVRGRASKRLTSPFARRVPSGNIATGWPSRASHTARSPRTLTRNTSSQGSYRTSILPPPLTRRPRPCDRAHDDQEARRETGREMRLDLRPAEDARQRGDDKDPLLELDRRGSTAGAAAWTAAVPSQVASRDAAIRRALIASPSRCSRSTPGAPPPRGSCRRGSSARRIDRPDFRCRS